MAKNPRLTVIFTASTAALDNALTRIDRKLKKFSRAINANAKVVAKWGVRIGAAASAVLVFFTRREFKALDAVAKLSDRIGIQTQKLAGLELAATQTGLSNEIFIKSIETMRKVLGDANVQELAQAKRAFAAIGLSSKQLASLSTFQQLKLIADGLNRMSSATDRASLAATIFGRAGGKQFLNFIALGSKGIEDFVKEADRLGLTFRRSDLARIEAFNDAIDKMQRITRAVFGEIAVNVAGVLETLVSRFNEVGGAAKGMREAIRSAFDGIKTFGFQIAESFDLMTISFKKLQLSIAKGRNAFGKKSGRSLLSFITNPVENFLLRPGAAISLGLEKLGFLEPGTTAKRADQFIAPQSKLQGTIDQLSKEIKQLEDSFGTSATPTQNKLFQFFQDVANRIGSEINKRLGLGRGGGETPSPSAGKTTAISDIFKGVGGFSGVSGLGTARELGIINGQPRFGVTAGIQSIGQGISRKINRIINILQRAENRAVGGQGGSTGVVFI